MNMQNSRVLGCAVEQRKGECSIQLQGLFTVLIAVTILSEGCLYNPAFEHGGYTQQFNVFVRGSAATTRPARDYAVFVLTWSQKYSARAIARVEAARLFTENSELLSIVVPRLHDSGNVYVYDRGFDRAGRRVEYFECYVFLPGYHTISVIPEGKHLAERSSTDPQGHPDEEPLVGNWPERDTSGPESLNYRRGGDGVEHASLVFKPLSEGIVYPNRQKSHAWAQQFDMKDVCEAITRGYLDFADPHARRTLLDALVAERAWTLKALAEVEPAHLLEEYEANTSKYLETIRNWAELKQATRLGRPTNGANPAVFQISVAIPRQRR